MVISLLLAGFIVYDKVIKKEEVKEPKKQEEVPKKEDENTNNDSEEEEILDSNTQVFYDTVTNQKYYLVTAKTESNGDIYDVTSHTILDKDKNKFADVPEVKTSHLWNINGKSLLDDEEEISTTAILKGNKIYSLDNNPNDECGFVKYEIYIENGILKKEIVSEYSDADINVNIKVSGEHC